MFRNLPPVTKNLLIINILIWAVMAFVPALDRSLLRYCALYYFESPGFGAWQLITYMFLHSGFSHLFFNMFALLMFGGIIEWTLGSKRFLVYYLSCGIGAAFVQLGIYALMLIPYHDMFSAADYSMIVDQGFRAMQNGQIFTDPTMAHIASLVNAPVVGASGAIYGVLLAFGMLYPNREIYLMFIPVPIKAKWMIVGYFVLELAMGIGSANDGVAHFAHLGGMIFGFMLLWYWKKKGTFSGWY